MLRVLELVERRVEMLVAANAFLDLDINPRPKRGWGKCDFPPATADLGYADGIGAVPGCLLNTDAEDLCESLWSEDVDAE